MEYLLFCFCFVFVFLTHLSTETAVGCPDHNNRPLEFYDKDDGQPVCSHCVVIGERQTHAIVPIDEIVRKFSFFKLGTKFCANLSFALFPFSVLSCNRKN